MIDNVYVSKETATLLKENGFDVPVDAVYDLYGIEGKLYFNFGKYNHNKHNDLISAPTQTIVCDWLRKKCNIDVEVHADVGMLGVKAYVPVIKYYKKREDGKLTIRQCSVADMLPTEILPYYPSYDGYEEANMLLINFLVKKEKNDDLL